MTCMTAQNQVQQSRLTYATHDMDAYEAEDLREEYKGLGAA